MWAGGGADVTIRLGAVRRKLGRMTSNSDGS
jgi:hypothetical protein